MNKTLKTTLAAFVAVAFFATTVLCCCVIKNAITHKAACSHCATKAKSDPNKECGFVKAIPMEITSNFHVLPLPIVFLAFAIALPLILPRRKPILKSAYIHGPPGPISAVPLYIRSRSLRL